MRQPQLGRGSRDTIDRTNQSLLDLLVYWGVYWGGLLGSAGVYALINKIFSAGFFNYCRQIQ